jgi:hypothetical protein
MRLLLHVGHAKTGTSSIQSSLAAARGPLSEAGVLYPMPPSFLSNSTNHNSLASGFGSEDRVLRGLKHKIQGSTLTTSDIFDRYCREIVSQIDKMIPHTIIISGEALFRPLDGPEADPFVKFVKSISNNISVCVYTRRPSEYYLSSMQQKLKASHFIISNGDIFCIVVLTRFPMLKTSPIPFFCFKILFLKKTTNITLN